jgi:hypothetical protein
MDLLDAPQDIPFLSGLIQREIIYRILCGPEGVSEAVLLQAARGRMLVDGLDAASAAFAVGYENASQFNREYSRLFGQPPMRDIRIFARRSAPRVGQQSAKRYLIVSRTLELWVEW